MQSSSTPTFLPFSASSLSTAPRDGASGSDAYIFTSGLPLTPTGAAFDGLLPLACGAMARPLPTTPELGMEALAFPANFTDAVFAAPRAEIAPLLVTNAGIETAPEVIALPVGDIASETESGEMLLRNAAPLPTPKPVHVNRGAQSTPALPVTLETETDAPAVAPSPLPLAQPQPQSAARSTRPDREVETSPVVVTRESVIAPATPAPATALPEGEAVEQPIKNHEGDTAESDTTSAPRMAAPAPQADSVPAIVPAPIVNVVASATPAALPAEPVEAEPQTVAGNVAPAPRRPLSRPTESSVAAPAGEGAAGAQTNSRVPATSAAISAPVSENPRQAVTARQSVPHYPAGRAPVQADAVPVANTAPGMLTPVAAPTEAPRAGVAPTEVATIKPAVARIESPAISPTAPESTGVESQEAEPVAPTPDTKVNPAETPAAFVRDVRQVSRPISLTVDAAPAKSETLPPPLPAKESPPMVEVSASVARPTTSENPASIPATTMPAKATVENASVQAASVASSASRVSRPIETERGPVTAKTTAALQRAVSTDRPAVAPEQAAEFAEAVQREPAVALPQSVDGWKKILLNTYKEKLTESTKAVGIKDAEADATMSALLAAPTPVASAAPAVQSGSGAYSSLPAEWAEKLVQMTARAERLAPARLEVRLPVAGGDDLRVQISCQRGQIRCEFQNASNELQTLFLREWPGLSQMFAKDSQVRVEQPTFTAFADRRPGAEDSANGQQHQQRRESSTQRDEDADLTRFLNANRRALRRVS